MNTGIGIMERRRRERVSVSIGILITSLDSREACKEQGGITIDVSSKGAQIRLGRPLAPDTRVRIDILNSKRVAGARVISCDPDGPQHWCVRVELLQQTGNFWGLKCPPKDWEERPRLAVDEWHG